METRELICINCPLGCALTVTLENGEVTRVTGNTCPRGEAYARKECTNPTLRVEGGRLPVVSVKTASDIPKGKITDCVRALKNVKVKAPVHIGDVILENAAGTGVNIIATKDVL